MLFSGASNEPAQRRRGSASDDVLLAHNDVPVVGNRSVRHPTFRFDSQSIHVPDVDLGIPETPHSAPRNARLSMRFPTRLNFLRALRQPAAGLPPWLVRARQRQGAGFAGSLRAAAFAAVHASGIGTSRPVAAVANFRSPRIESGHRASAGSVSVLKK
jgi:hypothetical protein